MIRGQIQPYQATGSGAIALSTTVGDRFRLSHLVLHFNTAPTTSEDITLTLNSGAGAAYDTVIYRRDPSAGALTDVAFIPDGDMVFVAGDELDLAYPNTDGRTIGASIYTEKI